MNTFLAGGHRMITTLLTALVAFIAGVWSAVSRASGSAWARPAFAAVACLIAGALSPENWLLAPVAFGALTEGQHTGEFILSEANGSRSREKVTVTVAADTTLEAGMVLAKLTATGKYVPYDNVGADGSEVAAGVLYGDLTNDTGAPADQIGVIIARDAEVRGDDLQWEATVDAAGETAGKADLAVLGILSR